jgi:hypothetical protein
MLFFSGAIENDFLVFGQVRQPGQKIREEKRPLQLHAPAPGFVNISADQECLAGLHPGVDLLRRNSYRLCHVLALLIRSNIIL